MTKLYTNSIIVFLTGILSLLLFLLMQYKSDLLSDKQLITVFFIYIISCVIFLYNILLLVKNSVKGE
jgi:hypothetical protein